MKAFAITRYGEPDYFTEIDLPRPTPGPGQVLVEVVASSVNPVDTKIRAGGRAMCPDLPAVLHMDVAGTVAELGAGVEGFAVGDPVYGCAGGLKTVAGENLGGALADYMLADARLLAPAPRSLPLADAAALPLVTITAWEGLLLRAGLGAGRRVLIHGGCGGVGHVAIQLARHAGAEVCTTVSSDAKAAVARELGAHRTIDYRARSVDEYVAEHTGGEGFDVVFDSIGGATLDASQQAARINGQVVTILASGEHELSVLHARGLTLHAVFMLIPLLYDRDRALHGNILRQAATLVDAGGLRPLIDAQRFPFERAGDAHRRLVGGEAIGKVVLER